MTLYQQIGLSGVLVLLSPPCPFRAAAITSSGQSNLLTWAFRNRPFFLLGQKHQTGI